MELHRGIDTEYNSRYSTKRISRGGCCMSDEIDHDERARRLLRGTGYEGLVGAETSEQTIVVHQATHLDTLRALEFLLGEREFDKNIFECSDPGRPNAKGLTLQACGAADKHLFVWEDESEPDFLKLQLRKITEIKDFGEEKGSQEVTLTECAYHIVLSRRKILTVQFEITKVKASVGNRTIRRVRIENEGGWFIYISDDGMMQCCPSEYLGGTGSEAGEMV